MTKRVSPLGFSLAASGVWLLTTAFLSGQTPATPAAQADLPAAKDIVARHIEASGGETAFRAIQSIHISGTFELTAQGTAGPFEDFSARPAMKRTTVELEGLGKIETGFDGKNAWEINPQTGPSVLAGRQASEMSDDAFFDAIFHGPEYVKEMKTVSKEEFDRKQAYKIDVTFVSGNKQFEYYDVASGLELGTESSRDSPMGVLPQISVMRDYVKHGDILVPSRLSTRTMGLEQVWTVKSVEFNKVRPAAFEPPPSVKVLIK